MVERLTGQHSEAAQAQQPLDSAIVKFCGKLTSANTKVAYTSDLRIFSRFATRANVTQLDQLTPEHIYAYFQYCEGSGLSNATINRRTASLSGLLEYEGMEELAKKIRDIGNKHNGSRPEMQPFHPLSADEVEKLQEASRNNPRASAIIAITLGTGATPKELQALNACDVLEQESQIVAIRFRGKKSERQVTLDINASEIVRRHKGNRGGEEPLFAQKLPIKLREVRLSRQSIWDDVKEYSEETGRPDLNPRVLRETFIANIKNKDSKELTRLLGVSEDRVSTILRRSRLTQLPQSGTVFEATTK